MNVNARDLEVTKALTVDRPDFGCDENFVSIALHFMGVNNRLFPKTFDEAKTLYFDLLTFIDDI